MKRFRMVPTLLTKYLIMLAYSFSSLFSKVNPDKVTFASYRSTDLEGNLFYLKEEINQLYPHIKCQVMVEKFNSSLPGKLAYIAHLLRASYHLATSRYFIIDDYYFPVYCITPRKGTEVIQVWHAAGAFKKFGLSTIDKGFGPSDEYLKHIKVHSNYSRVYVSSKEVIPHYAEAFGMDEACIYPLGLPRTDYFFEKGLKEQTKAKLYAKYPELANKQLILYAPTFRGRSHYQGEFEIPLELSRMKAELGDKYVLLVQLHPYMNKGVVFNTDPADFIYRTNTDFKVEEMLLAADILITDYSSIIFDYSLLNKPMAFFVHDLESYIGERDFYYPFESFIPGPAFKETDDMIEWLKKQDKDFSTVKHFAEKFFDHQDGESSRRIAEHLFKS